MINKFFVTVLVLFFLSVNFSFAQKNENDSTFKPSGSVILRSFMDYSTDFGSADKESGFDITRAFIGYKYQLTPTLSGQLIIDGASGRNASNNLEVYLRNAFLRWNDEGFDIHLGLIGLLQFSLQEKYWQHRYVLKSYQDLNKMAPSVDLGTTVKYDFNPFISADISLTNGEGYKDISKNNSTRYGAGVTVNPTKNIVFRVYADIYNESDDLRAKLPEGVENSKYKNQYILSLFSGYSNKYISGGVEFNKVFNKGFIEKKDYYGYSFYATGKVAPKWGVFGRYDITDSNTPDNFKKPWNDLDGQLAIVGVEFQPIKQLKISPNVRNINPKRDESEQYLFINIDFNW